MHVISYKAIREFVAEHPDASTPLDVWYRVAKRAKWQNLVEVRETYPHADPVGRFTVFNIKGNDYRLVVIIDYRGRRIFIKGVFTHVEYDKDKWKT